MTMVELVVASCQEIYKKERGIPLQREERERWRRRTKSNERREHCDRRREAVFVRVICDGRLVITSLLTTIRCSSAMTKVNLFERIRPTEQRSTELVAFSGGLFRNFVTKLH